MKYLVQDGDKVKKATMEGLQEVGDGTPIKEDFESYGTDYLPDIIGKYDKEVDMIYDKELGDRKLYGYELIGYTDLSLSSGSKGLMKSDSGEYYSYVDGELIKINNPIGEDDFINKPTNLEDLTNTTDRRVFTMENGEVAGVGKAYSKKVNPADWNRLIGKIDIK